MQFFDQLDKDSEKLGYVTTIYGRKRLVSAIEAAGRDRGFRRRAALNAPLQGSAADIIKLAMIAIDGRIRRDTWPVAMILQIHDELLFECEPSFLEEAKRGIREMMSSVVELKVPLKVDLAEGANWGEI
jgi:DNA polymerase-1